ncbi:hypothetical protein PMAYCL1PPCAC_18209 [Pristionchus mayeri]|uniref:Uncharacterized protein n=1 Tax=Pristionchus mayeri TaxID=1317129 RepID=A0AAN5I181_9BILA|nr:hypothetical protein PMAYCL1PPCAC_18209 [Pristionchus mayeri]
MVMTRDDCISVQTRQDGQSVVAASIVSLNPPIIQDSTSVLQISGFPVEVERGDYCYLLLECSTRPFKCIQITPIPPQLVSIARLQLSLYRRRGKRL